MAYYAFPRAVLLGTPMTLFGDGSVVRDFTYVDDVVGGIVRVLDRPAQPDPTSSSDTPDLATSTAPFRLYNIGHRPHTGLREGIASFVDWLRRYLGM